MHVRATPLPLLVLLGLAQAVCGCTAQGAPPAGEVRAPGTEQAAGQKHEKPLLAEEAAAVEAIRRGDYDDAHTILARLLFAGHMADARAALNAHRPEDALLDTEAALGLFPKDDSALLLDARATLALAEVSLAEGRPFARETAADALGAYERAGASGVARMGAARAAYLLGDSEQALAFAHEGMATVGGHEAELDRLPQRTYAEAAYAEYARRAQEGAPAEERRELFQVTEGALTSLLGRAPDDPWVYTTLAYLYEWEKRPGDARDVLVRGLHSIPNDQGMIDHLAQVARDVGGSAGSLAVFEALTKQDPEVARTQWYEASERFELALVALLAKDLRPEEFRRAEAGFARCRALEPSYAESCTQYEVLSRDGVGWCLYQAGDVEGARAAFSSMEELMPRGLQWQIEGRLFSGELGLAFCAKTYFERKGLSDLIAAGEINEFLRHYAPDNAAYANDAAFMFRDAAIDLERQAWRLCLASRGEIKSAEGLAELRGLAGVGAEVVPGSPAERQALHAASEERVARARELMQRSAVAYRSAAELAPEDVRIVNDAAVVLVYYLHEDVERAHAMLDRCAELAARQIERTDLEDEARKDLRTAWGDVHQNLGVLHSYYTDDKAAALAEFERAMEIDPEPRADEVVPFWIPFARGAIADPTQSPAWTKNWGEPCR